MTDPAPVMPRTLVPTGRHPAACDRRAVGAPHGALGWSVGAHLRPLCGGPDIRLHGGVQDAGGARPAGSIVRVQHRHQRSGGPGPRHQYGRRLYLVARVWASWASWGPSGACSPPPGSCAVTRSPGATSCSWPARPRAGGPPARPRRTRCRVDHPVGADGAGGRRPARAPSAFGSAVGAVAVLLGHAGGRGRRVPRHRRPHQPAGRHPPPGRVHGRRSSSASPTPFAWWRTRTRHCTGWCG